jgi:hypothetical protein
MAKSINKAFISFRLGVSTWLRDERFDEQMAMFDKYKGVTDEIAFFTSETHPCSPLAVIQDRCKILARRMEQVRARGYRAGINILSTIGHHNENLSNSLSGHTPMTDIDGQVCLGSMCPNDERHREYVQKIYVAMAKSKPDFIWIDDDVRLWGHMPILTGCFCDNCLSIYEKETGKKWTRETLKTAFKSMELRKAWLEHNRQTINGLFTLIEKTVHEIDPGLVLGFMTGDRYFEGYDFDRWAEILSGPKHLPVKWRPGGGFYDDTVIRGLVTKSRDIGRQISFLPECVQDIQSEIENFPYQRLKKAAYTTALESATYIAAGCTGTAFNVMSMYDEPLDEYDHLVSELHKSRPFNDLLARTLTRSIPTGIYTGWNKNSAAAANAGKENWFVDNLWTMGGGQTEEIFEIGLPSAFSPGAARATTFTGDQPLAFSDAELKKILSGGVYLDGPALTRLNEMGYGDYTGFSVKEAFDKDCVERLLDHPLNARFAGRKRDNRQSFLWWNVPAASLLPSAGALPISELVDYSEKQVAPCASGVFENKLGGRVFVAGYFPWTFLQNFSKALQMKNIFRWLSHDTLDAYIASYHKINLWARRTPEDLQAIPMINMSFDSAKNVELMIKTDHREILVYDMSCKVVTVSALGSDGPYRKFILPEIGGWQMRLVREK